MARIEDEGECTEGDKVGFDPDKGVVGCLDPYGGEEEGKGKEEKGSCFEVAEGRLG